MTGVLSLLIGHHRTKDYDKDGIPDIWDCQPRNPKKHGLGDAIKGVIERIRPAPRPSIGQPVISTPTTSFTQEAARAAATTSTQVQQAGVSPTAPIRTSGGGGRTTYTTPAAIPAATTPAAIPAATTPAQQYQEKEISANVKQVPTSAGLRTAAGFPSGLSFAEAAMLGQAAGSYLTPYMEFPGKQRQGVMILKESEMPKQVEESGYYKGVFALPRFLEKAPLTPVTSYIKEKAKTSPILSKAVEKAEPFVSVIGKTLTQPAPSWLVSAYAELPKFAAFGGLMKTGAYSEQEDIIKFAKKKAKGQLQTVTEQQVEKAASFERKVEDAWKTEGQKGTLKEIAKYLKSLKDKGATDEQIKKEAEGLLQYFTDKGLISPAEAQFNIAPTGPTPPTPPSISSISPLPSKIPVKAPKPAPSIDLGLYPKMVQAEGRGISVITGEMERAGEAGAISTLFTRQITPGRISVLMRTPIIEPSARTDVMVISRSGEVLKSGEATITNLIQVPEQRTRQITVPGIVEITKPISATVPITIPITSPVTERVTAEIPGFGFSGYGYQPKIDIKFGLPPLPPPTVKARELREQESKAMRGGKGIKARRYTPTLMGIFGRPVSKVPKQKVFMGLETRPYVGKARPTLRGMFGF